ncbi:MAG: hypothetical protein HC772_16620 [Leptolyngbyaceae cyanobacterium CRU_2_3]|nr:hypothetical protein [Leptolyngbyaceae cyanobacterium CRU_2_3]
MLNELQGMPRVKRMKNLAIFLTLFSLVDIVYGQRPSLSIPNPWIAVDPRDAICYMETQNGQIVDLSQVCGGREIQSTTLSNTFSTTDQQFFNDYQNVLRYRYGQSPSAQTTLSQAQQNPQAIIQRAQRACASIRDGMLPEMALFSERRVDTSLINTLALDHYCPELED